MKIRQAAVEEVLVTIPRGGLGTNQRRQVPVRVFPSPSHTVGLEKLVPRIVSFLHKSSPSHAVGLERLNKPNKGSSCSWSPSHTVGSELGEDEKRTRGGNQASPFHTVGSEPSPPRRSRTSITDRHPTRWAWNKKAIHFRKPLP
jgi:hypothetical protein